MKRMVSNGFRVFRNGGYHGSVLYVFSYPGRITRMSRIGFAGFVFWMTSTMPDLGPPVGVTSRSISPGLFPTIRFEP